MARPQSIAILAAVLVLSASVTAQSVKPLRLSEAFNTSATGFTVDVFPPDLWLAYLEQTAKKELRPFTVSPEMREDVWRVRTYPSTPRRANNLAGASSVSRVVIRTEDKSTVIEPLSMEPFEQKVSNSFGASFTYHGAMVTFPGSAVRELWGPTQDREFVITVIGDANHTYDFAVKKKHFEQLR